ncbi:MAG: molybdopterin dinucleotide binding domain-containing protein [Dehalococcoidia bacterium]|nr:molybdopterin dinucleotide binding domain-containing protein [Dehalococcoidia bacterium]
MGLGENFKNTTEQFLQDFLASGEPILEGITLEKLREEGAIRLNLPRPLVPFAERAFPTPSGRVEFYLERLVEIKQELPIHLEPLEGPASPQGRKYPLTFLTTHSRFSAQSQHFALPHVAALCPEPLLEINPIDALQRGIQDGDLVVVYNDRGECRVKARVTEAIKPGVLNVFQGWWPRDFPSGSQQSLTQAAVNPDQVFIGEANWAIYDCAVEARRAEA